jgi:AcrR family transcriptional regulator
MASISIESATAADVCGRLRADAARNRSALVQAGLAVFGERGLDAPLDEIARRAEVGNATLYRHFPTRCELVVAVYAETLREIVAACDAALANPDPWAGFTAHVSFLCELQARNLGLADLLTTRIDGSAELETLRELAHDGFGQIAARAIEAGSLSADFRPEDLVLLLMANAGLVRRTAVAAPSAWRRLLSYTLNGLAASPDARRAPAPVPDAAAIHAAMADVACSAGSAGEQVPAEPPPAQQHQPATDPASL